MPAYNEAGSIERTLRATRAYLDLQDYPYEIIAAVQGNDATADIVSTLSGGWPNLKLSSVPGRRGKGFGLRTGMQLATGQVRAFMDADNKTRVDELAKLLPWLGEGYQVVIGSRAVEGSHIEVLQPVHRQIGARIFALVMHTVVGLHSIHDTQCGFKLFTHEAAAEIFSRTRIDGYMTDIEILCLAQKLGYRVKEVGITWRDDGDSRLRLAADTLRNAIDLFRIRFGPVPGFRP